MCDVTCRQLHGYGGERQNQRGAQGEGPGAVGWRGAAAARCLRQPGVPGHRRGIAFHLVLCMYWGVFITAHRSKTLLLPTHHQFTPSDQKPLLSFSSLSSLMDGTRMTCSSTTKSSMASCRPTTAACLATRKQHLLLSFHSCVIQAQSSVSRWNSPHPLPV